MNPVRLKGDEVLVYTGDHLPGNVGPLATIKGDDGAIYSAWTPTFRERIALLFGEKVWVGILTERQPPISLTICKSVFKKP